MLNNISKWKRYSEAKIKNEYKAVLESLYIPNPPEKPHEALTIEYRLVRHNKRKIDSDNAIFALKYLSDVLEKLGFVDNDTNTQFKSFPKEVDETLSETMLDIRVYADAEPWFHD